MSDDRFDAWLDAQLRHVPVPGDLPERLRETGGWSEEAIDQELRRVPPPPQLLDALREIPAEESVERRLADLPYDEEDYRQLQERIFDEALDDALRSPPAPAAMLRRLRAITASRPAPWFSRHVAAAAVLVIAVGLAYVAGVAGLVASAYRAPEPDTIVMSRGSTVSFVASLDRGAVETILQEPPVRRDLFASLVVDQPPTFTPRPLPAGSLFDTVGRRAGHSRADGGRPFDLSEHLFSLRWRGGGSSDEVLGHAPTEQLAASPDPLLPLEARGMAAPLRRSVSTFDHWERLVAAGRLPAPHEVAVEDFIAAVDIGAERAPPGELLLRAHGGPAVFRPAGGSLLEFRVRAGAAVRRSEQNTAVHLVVTGLGGQSGAVRERTCRALMELARRLGPHDRVTLWVAGSGELRPLLDSQTPAALLAAAQSLRQADARRGRNVAAVLRGAAIHAVAAAERDRSSRHSLVVLAGSPTVWSHRGADAAGQMLAELADYGVSFGAVSIGDWGGGDRRGFDSWQVLAPGRVARARSADDITRALLASAGGAPPGDESVTLVATEVELRVRFNPRAVTAYRIVGHAPGAAGWLPAGQVSSLHDGESASVLYEVLLTGRDSDQLGEVELRWRDPVSGAARRHRQRLSRLQVAGSWRETALSLQAAALAAETAEILRGGKPRPLVSGGVVRNERQRLAEDELKKVLAAAEQASPALKRQERVERLLRLVEETSSIWSEQAGPAAND